MGSEGADVLQSFLYSLRRPVNSAGNLFVLLVLKRTQVLIDDRDRGV